MASRDGIGTAVGALVLAALLPAPAAAHDPDVGVARVTLRDGNVSVRLSVDIERCVMRAAGRTGSLVRAEMPPSDLDAHLEELRAALVEETRVRVGTEDMPVRLRSFPARERILAVAAQNFMAEQRQDHHHRARLDVHLEGDHAEPNAARVAVVFPARLGRVAVSFVEPQSRWVDGGEWAEFASFAGRPSSSGSAEGSTDEDEAAMTQPLPAALPVLGGAMVLALVWRERRAR